MHILKQTSQQFFLTFILLCISTFQLLAQAYPYDIAQYNFVRYDKNRFEFPGDSADWEKLFTKFDTLIMKGKNQVSIVHIGASHVQADIYTDRMRQRIQNFYPGLNAGRGFVFPYKMTRTNTPGGYYSTFTGTWEPCRNVDYRKTCLLGLSGLSATTHDSGATLQIIFRKTKGNKYDFNTIKVYHEMTPQSFSVIPDYQGLEYTTRVNDTIGYTLIHLNKYVDTLKIKLQKTSPEQQGFVLFGISLETEDPGVVYSSFGVNGASTISYLRCDLFTQHMKGYNPDWVVLSLGINDVYAKYFDSIAFENNLENLIRRTKAAAPDAAILLVVANDNYLFRRKPNPHTEKSERIVLKLAAKYNCGVWDFYQIMGG